MVANEGSSSQFLISNLRLNEVAMVIKKPKISPFAEILQIVDAPPLLYYCKSSRKGSCWHFEMGKNLEEPLGW